MEADRYEYYSQIVDAVESTIRNIQGLDRKKCFDTQYLEKTFIPEIGLNNEFLHEQPAELSAYFGKGLHLWQYPSQMSKYLVWLAHNAKHIRKYMEIGCRWGGMFIVISEWLKKIGAPLECAIALDPIEPTPFIEKYIEISDIPVVYLQSLSNSKEAVEYVETARPDMLFIDGDHSINAVMFDHILARKTSNIIVHHDICSQACPGSTLFWSYLRQAETDFEHFEFIDQYPSVNGNFLGIGVLKRKSFLDG
jgi:cephalosporin hydroxylase